MLGTVGRVATSIGLGVTFAVAAATPASGDIGVGITADPVSLGHPVAAGGSYAMGPVTVVNTGTEAGSVALRVAERPDSEGEAVPRAWVTFEQDEVHLDAGERTAVAITLTVPDDVPDGDYHSLLFAGLTKPGDGRASGIGAEAATELAVTIGDRSGSGQGKFNAWLPLGAIPVLAALALLKRRTSRHSHEPRHLKSNRPNRSKT